MGLVLGNGKDVPVVFDEVLFKFTLAKTVTMMGVIDLHRAGFARAPSIVYASMFFAFNFHNISMGICLTEYNSFVMIEA